MSIHVPHFVLLFATVLNVSPVQRYIEMLSVQLEQSLHCVLLWHTEEALARREKSMRSHLEPFSCEKERERSDRDNWDLNDVSTRNLNWMSKWHHYLRLSCAKRLFFRKAIKQAIGGGLYLKWTAARNMKYNLLPLMQSRSNDSMHASRPFSHSLCPLLVHSSYHTVVLSELFRGTRMWEGWDYTKTVGTAG